MSKDAPKTETPKTVPVAAVAKTPAELEHERMLAVVRALPPDAQVFVLTPDDDNERRLVLEQLEDALFKYFEVEPKHHHELKVARLPYGSFLFVAHCTTSRGKRDDGTFGPISKIHIGGPVDLKQYSARSADGYTWSVNTGAIIDAVVKVCKHTDGTVWMPMLSGDPDVDQKVMKLKKC